MTPCPDHEALACFLEHRLAGPERAEVERHVACCPACLDVVAAAAPAGAGAESSALPARPRLASVIAPPDQLTGQQVPVGEPGPRATRSDPHPASTRRWWPQTLAAGLTLLVTGALGYLATGAAGEQARVIAMRMASERLGVAVDIQQIELALTPDLRSMVVRMLELDLGARGRADAAEIVISLGVPAVHGLRVLAPELHWTLSDDDLGGPLPRNALDALALAPTVEIIDGKLRVARPDGRPIVLEHLSGTTWIIGARVHVRATGNLGGGRLTLRGTLDTGESPHLDLTIGGRDLPSGSLPYLPDWAVGRTALALRVMGDPSSLRWGGRLHVAAGTVRGLAPLRDLAAAFRIEPDMLSPAAGAPTDVRATFRVDQGGWRVPRSVVVHGDVETHATLRSLYGARLSGEGIARLSASRTRALIERSPSIGLYGTPAGRLALPFRLQGVPGRVALLPGR